MGSTHIKVFIRSYVDIVTENKYKTKNKHIPKSL